MGWIIASGTISLLFGLILFFSRPIFESLSRFFNQPVLIIEDKVNKIRVCAGVFFLVAGGWMVVNAVAYPALWYLSIAGGVVIIFGILYIFIPSWVRWLSRAADHFLLSTDDFIIEARKIIGLILIAAAVYNLLSAFIMR